MSLIMNKITELKDNQIFVFGSNLAGRHGAGAAKDAMEWGAVYGLGEGHAGQTYAIPTKDGNLKPLPLVKILEHVDNFYNFACSHRNLQFLVTKIGCGLAGYDVKDIGLMFRHESLNSNITLPKEFSDLRNKEIPELKDQQLKILKDTIDYYSEDINRRSVEGSHCKYSHPIDKRSCAAGRYMTDPTQAIEGKSISNCKNLLLIDKKYNRNRDFWSRIQYLHDQPGHWNENGLSERGKSEAEVTASAIINGRYLTYL